jgi:hypothetical protein
MARPLQFKIGSDAWGLLRPDKIVAYFPDFERLAEAAGGLAEGLSRALLTAREAGEAEPWRFALDRLRLEGIDTATWTPGSRLWRER